MRKRLGRHGELVAARHLESLGYRVVGSGFLARRGEIDLVCRRRDELVMVEVKARSGDRFGTGMEAITLKKRRAMSAAAAEYRALSSWRGAIRFAIVTVDVGPGDEVRQVALVEDPF